MIEKLIPYEHRSTTLEAYLAYDDSRDGPLPGVLIAHAWGGRGELECARARALAGQGYAGIALDLYGKGILGSGPEENAELMQPFMEDRGFLQDRLSAAHAIHRSVTEKTLDELGRRRPHSLSTSFQFHRLGQKPLEHLRREVVRQR